MYRIAHNSAKGLHHSREKDETVPDSGAMPDGELSSSVAPCTPQQRTGPLTQHKRGQTRSYKDTIEPHQRRQQSGAPAVLLNEINQHTS